MLYILDCYCWKSTREGGREGSGRGEAREDQKAFENDVIKHRRIQDEKPAEVVA